MAGRRRNQHKKKSAKDKFIHFVKKHKKPIVALGTVAAVAAASLIVHKNLAPVAEEALVGGEELAASEANASRPVGSSIGKPRPVTMTGENRPRPSSFKPPGRPLPISEPPIPKPIVEGKLPQEVKPEMVKPRRPAGAPETTLGRRPPPTTPRPRVPGSMSPTLMAKLRGRYLTGVTSKGVGGIQANLRLKSAAQISVAKKMAAARAADKLESQRVMGEAAVKRLHRF